MNRYEKESKRDMAYMLLNCAIPATRKVTDEELQDGNRYRSLCRRFAVWGVMIDKIERGLSDEEIADRILLLHENPPEFLETEGRILELRQNNSRRYEI